MEIVVEIPDLGDAQLTTVLNEAGRLRSQAILQDRAAVVGHIDACFGMVRALLGPLLVAYRKAVEASADTLSLYRECCALQSVVAEFTLDAALVHRANLLDRSRLRLDEQLQVQLKPIRDRLREAFQAELAEAKAQLRALAITHRSIGNPRPLASAIVHPPSSAVSPMIAASQ